MDASYIENYSQPFQQNYGLFQSELANQQIKDTLDEGGISLLGMASTKLMPYAKTAIEPVLQKFQNMDSPNFQVVQQFQNKPVRTFGEESDDLAEVLGQNTANKSISSDFIRAAPEAADVAEDVGIGASSILEGASVIGLPLALGGMGYLLSNLLEHHSAPEVPQIEMAPSIKF